MEKRKKDLQRRYLFCRHVVFLIPAMCLCHPFYAAQSALSSPCHLPHTHPQMESIYFLFPAEITLFAYSFLLD